jgi:hypothetical protein
MLGVEAEDEVFWPRDAVCEDERSLISRHSLSQQQELSETGDDVLESMDKVLSWLAFGS